MYFPCQLVSNAKNVYLEGEQLDRNRTYMYIIIIMRIVVKGHTHKQSIISGGW